ncbi:MAG TPA: CvpA family protein [Chitinophagales bacterium]|nr:CvpA family protein [Chitinophagales bacterium]
MIFDILFLIFIGLGFYQGFKNGIIYAIFSLLGWFLGLVAALKFSYLLVNLLQGLLHFGPKVSAIISFILVLALVLLLTRLIAWGLEKILKSFALNLPNQIIGGIIYSLIGLYVLCIFVWFLNRIEVFPDSQKKTSHVYPYIADLAPHVAEVSGKVVPYFRDTFHQFDNLFGSK